MTELAAKEARCVGVVDGGMFVTEAGETVVLARVRVPRMGLPGGAVLRMLVQRVVQDRDVQLEAVGRDHAGHVIAEVWVDGRNVNDYMLQCVTECGYGHERG
ncbi:MAG: hypothetical protein HYV93_18160 [Candidatus Rokubacteria bacterium]|nr:hypothetical protein [Candidatus Rokubacteria bacterium]